MERLNADWEWEGFKKELSDPTTQVELGETMEEKVERHEDEERQAERDKLYGNSYWSIYN